MPRKGWPLAPAFGGCGLDGAWRSAEVCHQEIDGEVWPRCNFKPLVFSQFQTAVDMQVMILKRTPLLLTLEPAFDRQNMAALSRQQYRSPGRFLDR
jgi:hypothetical protein